VVQDKARCVNLMREGTLGKNLRGIGRDPEIILKNMEDGYPLVI
jgi:hypothetical protein